MTPSQAIRSTSRFPIGLRLTDWSERPLSSTSKLDNASDRLPNLIELRRSQVIEMNVSCSTGSVQLRICVVLPVYNDWVCLTRLLPEIDQALSASRCTATVVIINDGGEEPP